MNKESVRRRGRPPKVPVVDRYRPKFLARVTAELARSSPDDLTVTEVEGVIENWRREKGPAELQRMLDEE